MVEHRLAKARVEGSNPFSRSSFHPQGLSQLNSIGIFVRIQRSTDTDRLIDDRGHLIVG